MQAAFAATGRSATAQASALHRRGRVQARPVAPLRSVGAVRGVRHTSDIKSRRNLCSSLSASEVGQEAPVTQDLPEADPVGQDLLVADQVELSEVVEAPLTTDLLQDEDEDTDLADLGISDLDTNIDEGEQLTEEELQVLQGNVAKAQKDMENIEDVKLPEDDLLMNFAAVNDILEEGDEGLQAFLAEHMDEELLSAFVGVDRFTRELVSADAATLEELLKAEAELPDLEPELEMEMSTAAVAVSAVAAAASSAVAAAKPAPAPVPAPAPTPATGGVSATAVKALRDKTGAGMMDCKKALTETGGDEAKATEWLKTKGLLSAGKKAGRVAADGCIRVYTHPDARFGVLLEVNCETDFVAGNEKFFELVNDLTVQLLPDPNIRFVSFEEIPEDVMAKEREIVAAMDDIKEKPEAVRGKIIEGRVQKNLKEQCLMEAKFWKDDSKTTAMVVKEAITALGENIKVRRFQRLTLGEGLAKKESNLAAEVAQATSAAPPKPKAEEPAAPPPAAEPEAPKANVQVSASAVKELREQTGAGMMDCKKALVQCGGDPVLAAEWLRKKGMAGAAKKAARQAVEGLIVGYSHPDARFGLLVEVNCETDFVAGNGKFYEFAQAMAMCCASNKEIQYVTMEDIPADVLEAERAAALASPDVANKPEEIRNKIAEGRVRKMAENICLLDQPYVYDTSKTVNDVVKETIATLGENIKVRRLLRYDLGSGIEKKKSDLAAEVAAMTGQA